MKCKKCGTNLENNINICPSCNTNQNDGKAIASLVIGIISLIIWPFGLTILLTLIGLILGISQKGKDPKKTIGLILNIISLVLEVIVIIIFSIGIKYYINKVKDVKVNEKFGYVEKYIEEGNISSLVSIITDWNKYSELRKDQLGTKLDINGEYRILSKNKNYVVIKNNEYYKYLSLDNIEDNYEYGKIEVLKGANGLSAFGIDPNEIQELINNKIIEVSIDNIYVVTYNQEKKVVDNKIETPSTEPVLEIWILIDHKKEGIQAINIDVENGSFTSYVKVKD